MNISEDDLHAEYEAATAAWPFIAAVEAEHRLPAHLLIAVGSRETNMRNVIGEQAPDGTRGHGVWQYEDGGGRVLPRDFDRNVTAQCQQAALMLTGLLAHYGGDVQKAADAYNEGQGAEDANSAAGTPDAGTAHGDYGADVLGRLHYLQHAFPTGQMEDGMSNEFYDSTPNSPDPHHLLDTGSEVLILWDASDNGAGGRVAQPLGPDEFVALRDRAVNKTPPAS